MTHNPRINNSQFNASLQFIIVKKKEDKIHKRMNIHLYLRSSYENTRRKQRANDS